jgi:hypothetical protein
VSELLLVPVVLVLIVAGFLQLAVYAINKNDEQFAPPEEE